MLKAILLLSTICLAYVNAQSTCPCGPLRSCLEEKKRSHLEKLEGCHQKCKDKLQSEAAEKCISGKKQELEQSLNSMADCIFNPANKFCVASSSRAIRQVSGLGGVDHQNLPSVVQPYKDCVRECVRSSMNAGAGGGAGGGSHSRQQHIFAAVKNCTDTLQCTVGHEEAINAFKTCRGQNGASNLGDAKREICNCLKNALPADQTASMQC